MLEIHPTVANGTWQPRGRNSHMKWTGAGCCRDILLRDEIHGLGLV